MFFLPNFCGISKKISNPLYLQRIINSESAASDYFGYSVSISLDGNTLAIGAFYRDETNLTNVGAVYIYTKANGLWSQEAKIIPTGSVAEDHIGYAVSVSGDGTRVAFSAPDADNGAALSNAGAIYVYVKSVSTWTQEYKYVASANNILGWHLAINEDGSKIIAGAPYADYSSYIDIGSAYFFSRTNSTWSLVTTLTPSTDPTSYDYGGKKVAISGDGNTAVFCVEGDDYFNGNPSYYDTGAAFVFVRNTSTGAWSQQAKLTASDYALNDMFGEGGASLSYDGNTLAVTSRRDSNSNGGGAGSVYVYTRSGTAWTQTTRLQSSDGIANDNFGVSTSLNRDGTVLAVGSFGSDINGLVNTGAVYIFKKISGTWTQINKIWSPVPAAGELMGYRVALASYSNDLVISEVYSSSNRGSVYMYKLNI